MFLFLLYHALPHTGICPLWNQSDGPELAASSTLFCRFVDKTCPWIHFFWYHFNRPCTSFWVIMFCTYGWKLLSPSRHKLYTSFLATHCHNSMCGRHCKPQKHFSPNRSSLDITKASHFSASFKKDKSMVGFTVRAWSQVLVLLKHTYRVCTCRWKTQPSRMILLQDAWPPIAGNEVLERSLHRGLVGQIIVRKIATTVSHCILREPLTAGGVESGYMRGRQQSHPVQRWPNQQDPCPTKQVRGHGAPTERGPHPCVACHRVKQCRWPPWPHCCARERRDEACQD